MLLLWGVMYDMWGVLLGWSVMCGACFVGSLLSFVVMYDVWGKLLGGGVV